jgi:hypothetical protein
MYAGGLRVSRARPKLVCCVINSLTYWRPSATTPHVSRRGTFGLGVESSDPNQPLPHEIRCGATKPRHPLAARDSVRRYETEIPPCGTGFGAALRNRDTPLRHGIRCGATKPRHLPAARDSVRRYEAEDWFRPDPVRRSGLRASPQCGKSPNVKKRWTHYTSAVDFLFPV